MDILINNPISLMYGPHFLGLYAGVIAGVGTTANLILKGKTTDTKTIPTNPDPYEIAYLRDGEKAVIKIACLELLQRGAIAVNEDRLENVTGETIDLNALSAIEKIVYEYLNAPKTIGTLTDSLSLKHEIALHCQDYQDSLFEQGYLNSETKGYVVGGVGAFIVLGLGSYKIISALSRGHYNILFLLAMAIAATFWLGIISCPPYSRQTAKGKQYLSNLQQAFSNLLGKLTPPPSQPDYNVSLMVALYDWKAIEQISIEAYESFIDLIKAKPTVSVSISSNSTSNSGCSTYTCGSSCGSSCGGGCGGGCGGCGG